MLIAHRNYVLPIAHQTAMLIKNQFHVSLNAQMQMQQYLKLKLTQPIITMYASNNAHYLIMLISQVKDVYLLVQIPIIMI